jgi:cysteinyl-tRNA synthetase
MGHARTYLGFDIIRRILQDYFKYNVTLIMNVTDLDDKIIERSIEQGITHMELSQHWEREFHKDMVDLGVSPPDVLTRVTEFMEPIVDYIQHIIEQGFAYESQGSVYFDVVAFETNPNHNYCKLEPEQILNAQLLAEGEGKLSQTHANEKKSARDFALWKKTKKESEPSWPSPWGGGRPGWHIECSVMASAVLRELYDVESVTTPYHPDIMDIHSGGVDLKFPHHDNEMAQAEAHSGCSQWVNYFVHSGHLHIQGFKMSKSLKNFITIQQALGEHSARQIRLLFLLHKYNAPMDYGDNTMSHALVVEKQLTEFFHNTKAVLRQAGGVTQVPQVWKASEYKLQKMLQTTTNKVDAAFKDDFDTPEVMSLLVDLIKATNVYYAEHEKEKTPPLGLVVRNVALFITRILKVVGLVSPGEELGFDRGAGSGEGEAGGGSGILEPVLDALMEFRSSVREKARGKDMEGVLKECDAFRDDVLPELGVRLEDKAGSKSVWKLADPEELKKEKLLKEQEQQRRLEEKEKAAAEKAAKDALNKMSPADYMKQLTLEDGTTAQYTQFDEQGMPTHANDGEALNKNQLKKASKAFAGQQKKYEKYLKSTE